MATYTKATLIEKTVSDDLWISKAILRIANMVQGERLTLPPEDLTNLNYWTGWIVGDRNLDGRHRDGAIELIQRKDVADALWRYALENTVANNA